jgi:hypothetical protein
MPRRPYDPLAIIPSPEVIRELLNEAITRAERLRVLLELAERLQLPLATAADLPTSPTRQGTEADPIGPQIDPTAMSLSAVARRLPGRNGAHVNPSTVARWVHKGATTADGKRVRLAAVRFGGVLYVTETALSSFLSALNAPPVPEAQQRSPAARRKAADEAVRRLNEMGA